MFLAGLDASRGCHIEAPDTFGSPRIAPSRCCRHLSRCVTTITGRVSLHGCLKKRWDFRLTRYNGTINAMGPCVRQKNHDAWRVFEGRLLLCAADICPFASLLCFG